jgi:small subunit ribosomal protein S1
LQKGERRKGTVSSIVNFGAFVDLGGVDGLVHVSELSWKHVDHPSEVVQVGQEVEVEVLDVDLERERVSLSLKATQEDPWKEFERKYRAGEIITGQVTKIVPFGAFVRVAQGIEGLVHISELSNTHVESPESVVNVGDQVQVKVIDVDVSRRRISLSMRQVAEGEVPLPEPEIEAETTPELVEEVAAEPSEETAEVVADSADRADESSQELLEAVIEPEPEAPEEAAVHEAPAPEPAVEDVDEAAPADEAEEGEEGEEGEEEEEDVSLESILEDLKRREGRSE